MKKFIIASLLAASMSVAVASDDKNELVEKCDTLGMLSETIMKARQAGVGMSAIMKVVVNSGSNEKTNEIAIMMIKDAYSETKYSTTEVKNAMVQQFRDRWEVACYESAF